MAAFDVSVNPVPVTVAPGSDIPDPRGWLAFDSCKSVDASNVCALFGGLAGDDEMPERLADLWTVAFSPLPAAGSAGVQKL